MQEFDEEQLQRYEKHISGDYLCANSLTQHRAFRLLKEVRILNDVVKVLAQEASQTCVEKNLLCSDKMKVDCINCRKEKARSFAVEQYLKRKDTSYSM